MKYRQTKQGRKTLNSTEESGYITTAGLHCVDVTFYHFLVMEDTMRFRKQNRWRRRRFGKLTRHHNLAKSRHGSNDIGNIIWLTDEHHKLFHKLFGNRTLVEAIEVLERLESRRKKKAKLRLVA